MLDHRLVNTTQERWHRALENLERRNVRVLAGMQSFAPVIIGDATHPATTGTFSPLDAYWRNGHLEFDGGGTFERRILEHINFYATDFQGRMDIVEALRSQGFEVATDAGIDDVPVTVKIYQYSRRLVTPPARTRWEWALEEVSRAGIEVREGVSRSEGLPRRPEDLGIMSAYTVAGRDGTLTWENDVLRLRDNIVDGAVGIAAWDHLHGSVTGQVLYRAFRANGFDVEYDGADGQVFVHLPIP